MFLAKKFQGRSRRAKRGNHLGATTRFFKEAEAHEDEESNIKEDFEWFSNYEKFISIQKI